MCFCLLLWLTYAYHISLVPIVFKKRVYIYVYIYMFMYIIFTYTVFIVAYSHSGLSNGLFIQSFLVKISWFPSYSLQYYFPCILVHPFCSRLFPFYYYLVVFTDGLSLTHHHDIFRLYSRTIPIFPTGKQQQQQQGRGFSRLFVGRPPQKTSAGGAPWEEGRGFLNIL